MVASVRIILVSKKFVGSYHVADLCPPQDLSCAIMQTITIGINDTLRDSRVYLFREFEELLGDNTKLREVVMHKMLAQPCRFNSSCQCYKIHQEMRSFIPFELSLCIAFKQCNGLVVFPLDGASAISQKAHLKSLELLIGFGLPIQSSGLASMHMTMHVTFSGILSLKTQGIYG
jgi:hypothetical protein